MSNYYQLHQLTYDVLPAALEELAANQENLDAISDWCTSTYLLPSEDKKKTVELTKSYAKDALLTVAHHMCSTATCLTSTLELQAAELESVEALVRLVEDQHGYQKAHLGKSANALQAVRRNFCPKLAEPFTTHCETPAQEFLWRRPDGRLNLTVLDQVGELPGGAEQAEATPPPAPLSSQRAPPVPLSRACPSAGAAAGSPFMSPRAPHPSPPLPSYGGSWKSGAAAPPMSPRAQQSRALPLSSGSFKLSSHTETLSAANVAGPSSQELPPSQSLLEASDSPKLSRPILHSSQL